MKWLAVFCLFAVPATAQDLPFSTDATEACLAKGGGQDCVGIAAQACIDTPDGYTTVGMGYCYAEEWRWWDGRLNEIYGSVMESEEALEAEMEEIGATVPSTTTPLREMQRAWIPYRDALCDYTRAQWGGGTGQGPATAECLMRETARQALHLIERMRWFEEIPDDG